MPEVASTTSITTDAREALAKPERNKLGMGSAAGGKGPGYNWACAVVQMAGAVVIGALALEGIFYWSGVGETEHLRPDRELGFKPFENKQITQRKEGFGRFVFNSYGMQNNVVVQAKPAGTLRVAVFGDSYVESLQVPREKNYTSLLSGELSARLGRPVETMNFGVSNYSVAQDYLRYLTLGRKFKPDLVVLAYRVGETEKLLPNPSKALAFVRPVFFKMADDSLKYDNSVVTDFLSSREGKRMLQTGWLRQYSHVWGVVGRMQQTWIVACDGISSGIGGGVKGALASLQSLYSCDLLKTAKDAARVTAGSAGVKSSVQVAASAGNGAGVGVDVVVAKDAGAGVGVGLGAAAPVGNGDGKGAEAAKPVDTGNKIVADLKTREGFVNCYWPMMDAQLAKFAADCRADGARFLVLRTPMVHPGVYELEVNPLETERLLGTAMTAGASFLNVDMALKHKVDAAKYPSFFHDGGHFAPPLHKFVAEELADFISREHVLGR
jgi:hypothetical protein